MYCYIDKQNSYDINANTKKDGSTYVDCIDVMWEVLFRKCISTETGRLEDIEDSSPPI
jgi:hypothetical protein